jgi:NAD dependent epimerase/dehydratase
MDKNSNWTKKNILVTGAGGFIGSHLAEELAMKGANVRAFVKYNSRGDTGLLRMLSPQTLSKIKIISGDLRYPEAVEEAAKGCDIIFHLGALISIPFSYKEPYEVAETNLLGTLNVLMATRKQKVSKLIHTSTSEVYGTAQQVPISETHPLRGQSPYSASKIGADKLAESFYCTYGLPVITIRPFNTYGPRQSARAVIPSIITQALVQNKIRIGNLNATRDFTYITDTVNGFIKAAETTGIEGRVINLGTGLEIRIGDLAAMIIKIVNPAIVLENDPKRMRPKLSEVFRLISDNSLAKELMGWQPEVDLGQGLTKTINWMRDHLDHYEIGKYEL